MTDDSIEERIRPVYQKDLYDEYYSLNVRIASDKLDHGDKLHVTVQKIDDRAIEAHTAAKEGEDKSDSGELLRSAVVRLRKLWKVIHGT